MSAESPVPPFPMRASLVGLTVLVVGAAAGMVAGLLFAGEGAQVAPAVGGAAVALAAGMLGLLPLHWAPRQSTAAVPMLAMAGTGLRMVATLAGAAVLIAGLGLAMPAAAFWTLGWYLLVMVFEITLLIRYFRSLPRSMSRGDDRSTDSHDPRRNAGDKR